MLHFDDYLDSKVKNNPLSWKLPDVEISRHCNFKKHLGDFQKMQKSGFYETFFESE
ncbi:hypothetical protein J0871_07510 [Salegentibacter sp. BDJ18]|uniref:hypothetical protein n=1 Tax=Salegentibacter sp. BDJ18 TaxID=2816376 RepID=UPI001AB01413|nr:hypothetical protein [Salegentibacter sp. BDJ18]MBO2544259.1 hypothetical protein [Salegentibacter sp. BDJ18]